MLREMIIIIYFLLGTMFSIINSTELMCIEQEIFNMEYALDCSNQTNCYLPFQKTNITSLCTQKNYKLVYLNLSGNNLKNIMFLSHCFNLQHLDLSHNKLKQVPSIITNFSVLNYLDISYNKLEHFNESFGNLSFLVLAEDKWNHKMHEEIDFVGIVLFQEKVYQKKLEVTTTTNAPSSTETEGSTTTTSLEKVTFESTLGPRLNFQIGKINQTNSKDNSDSTSKKSGMNAVIILSVILALSGIINIYHILYLLYKRKCKTPSSLDNDTQEDGFSMINRT